jgi:hypothetical protein
MVYATLELKCNLVHSVMPLLLHNRGIKSSNLFSGTNVMYKVSKQIHERYGNIIEITRDDTGEFENPFQAINKAITIRRLWFEESNSKIRFLIEDQLLTRGRAEVWANNEYKSLPKCEECAKILSGSVYTHEFCGSSLFCSQSCSDKNYIFQIEKMNDNEENEYNCI